jgi:hypothetical protein
MKAKLYIFVLTKTLKMWDLHVHISFRYQQSSAEKSKNWKNKAHLEEQLIVFVYIVRVLQHGASKTRNPLTVWGEIFQTILVKSAPEIFRIKWVVSQPTAA